MTFPIDIPFSRHMGFALISHENGESEFHYDPLPEHLNSFEVVHGGACMALLDVTLAAAGRSMAKEMGTITIELKTSFLQPARGKLIARGSLIHRTGTMAFAQGTVFDSEGRACAHATGTFKYVKRKITSPESQIPTD